MATERVVSREVVGSSNPFARKFRDIKNAFAGVGFGFIAIIVGFVLIFASVRSVKENSKVAKNLDLESSSEATIEDGIRKIAGVPEVTNENIFSYTGCYDMYCDFSDEEVQEIRDALYLNYQFERFEVVEEIRQETRTVYEGGKEIKETVEITEYNEKWVDHKDGEMWSDFKLGEIEIDPESAKKVFVLEKKEVNDVFITDLPEVNTYGQNTSAQVGDTRLTVNYLPADQEIIIIGEVSGSKISGGESFIVSNKGDEELVESLETEENTMRWGMRIMAWLMLTIGMGLIMAPIFEFVEVIPLVGPAAKSAAMISAAILSAILVAAGIFVVQFWYICLGMIVLLIGLGVYLIVNHVTKDKEVAKKDETPKTESDKK